MKIFGVRFGFLKLVSLFGILLLLTLTAAIVVAMFVQPSIHSCQMYVPRKTASGMIAIDSVASYAQREGFVVLLQELASILTSNLFDSPPVPEMKELVAGSHLLMVGGARTPTALRRARQLNVRMTLVDDESMRSWSEQAVGSFIGIADFGRVSVSEPQVVLQAVRRHLEASGEKLDGVFTLVEDHGPLVSLIGEALSLPCSPLKAAQTARNKYLVRKAMESKSLPVPRFWLIESENDATQAAAHVGFPAFLKPVYGVQMILESLLGGNEVQLELMIHNGKLGVLQVARSSLLSRHAGRGSEGEAPQARD
ncbi:hypothetical protein GUITHDRAFT_145087 [Guillardia theta CCMP2712]|uniref:ATP-grasp domain-containing protein n=1 Tax=Guillardia theta (strain CCMP2712) TaxID=905079 RepID=L1IMS4_GUITC|nr:hypothetical protein GUITHDRAFT_145087 [Guillardia theta CCMP2712]EKX37392.1 hypothetical protein GUITHDRAFT_145087 [Guillardia theta CCMP2712]|eukprot:XP_005824372.1 hypothetical protein GUITHDRAFT_145087 [Guillardia theta CCMP2712]